MTEVPRPARRTVMCAATLLGASATLAACGNGESAAPVNTPAPIPSASGDGQIVLAAEQLPVLSRAQVAAQDPATGHDVGVLLFRKDEQTVLAYSNICTHQGCAVGVKSPSKDDFYCACHASHFEPEGGTATAGPAQAALTRYGCAIEGDDIVIYIPHEEA